MLNRLIKCRFHLKLNKESIYKCDIWMRKRLFSNEIIPVSTSEILKKELDISDDGSDSNLILKDNNSVTTINNIHYFRNIGMKNDTIKALVQKYPHILNINLRNESIHEKIKFFMDMGFSNEGLTEFFSQV